MSKKQSQQEQAAALPQQPERKADAQLDELGFQADAFRRSPEQTYLDELLERMTTNRLWDKLNLSAGNADELRRLCIEIELLNEVKISITRDINAGRAAREREAKRLGA